MRQDLRDYLFTMSSGTIARLIGSPRYADIDRAFNAVIDLAEDRGILYSYDYTPQMVAELFKEVA